VRVDPVIILPVNLDGEHPTGAEAWLIGGALEDISKVARICNVDIANPMPTMDKMLDSYNRMVAMQMSEPTAPTPTYVHPSQFDALVRLGYIDATGRWLPRKQ